MKNFINVSSLFILIGMLFSCSGDIDVPKEDELELTIYETLKLNPNYSTVVEAIEMTGLSDKLSQTETNITFFAPSNQAFIERFSLGVGGDVLSRIPQKKLKQMLLSHIVEGANRSTDFYSGYYPSQAKKGSNNKNLSIYISTLNNDVVLNGYSKVMQKDVFAKNGVIHYVNGVLEPANLWTFLKADEQLTDLFVQVSKSNVANEVFNTLNFKKPVTFFAVSNQALKDTNVDGSTLLYHIIMKENLCSETEDTKVMSINGHKIIIKFKKGQVELIDEMNKSTELLFKSIQAVNGELHILNDVLTPKS